MYMAEHVLCVCVYVCVCVCVCVDDDGVLCVFTGFISLLLF